MVLDAVTGGVSGLVVSIGKSIFGKSDDVKILELEQLREEQRARLVTSTTLPNNELHVVELLEYVFAQTKVKHGDWDGEERKAWKGIWGWYADGCNQKREPFGYFSPFLRSCQSIRWHG